MTNQVQKSRRSAYARQGGKCYYCGCRMWLNDPPGPRALRCTAEHLRARCDGGGNGASNVVAACWFCNRTRHRCKQPLDPEAYRAKVRRQMELGKWLPRSARAWAMAQRSAFGASAAAFVRRHDRAHRIGT